MPSKEEIFEFLKKNKGKGYTTKELSEEFKASRYLVGKRVSDMYKQIDKYPKFEVTQEVRKNSIGAKNIYYIYKVKSR